MTGEGGGKPLSRPHTCPGVRLWRRGTTLSGLGSRGLKGGAQLSGMPQQRERAMPVGGGTELDQKSPNWDDCGSGLHGGSFKDITGMGSGWLRAGEGLGGPWVCPAS